MAKKNAESAPEPTPPEVSEQQGLINLDEMHGPVEREAAPRKREEAPARESATANESPKDDGALGEEPVEAEGGIEDSAEAASDADSNEIPDDLVARAGRYGFSEDDARAFGSSAALDRAMLAIDRQVAKVSAALGPGPSQEKTAEKQETRSPAPASSGGSVGFEFEDYTPQIDKDEFPELHAEATRMAQHFKAQVQKQVQAIAPLLNALDQKSMQVMDFSLTGRLDNLLEKMGSEYAEYVGDGDYIDMDPDSPQFKARTEAYQMAAHLRQRWQQMGQRLTWKESLQRALDVTLYDQKATIARKAATKDGGPTRTGMARPSRPAAVRQPSKAGPDERAKQFLDKGLRDLGVRGPSRQEVEDELAGIVID